MELRGFIRPDGPGGRHYNLIPFRSIYRIGVFSPDVIDPIKILIGNVLLFVPFGFFCTLSFKEITITLESDRN
ncbi:hypothetical protein JCM19055_4946 [Geomicrobium sp. JCM 19055]|nr:VanZ family protein [Geomicrobium sp. JCM 19055]GAK01740.1 hypothetical protein JCM19055_4946 [Geomicrobium sp. JCM 19055]